MVPVQFQRSLRSLQRSTIRSSIQEVTTRAFASSLVTLEPRARACYSSSDFVNNVAMKYDLEPTQVKVSKVEGCGTISFQVMPFYVENRMDFQKKIDQIDVDVRADRRRARCQSRTSRSLLVEFPRISHGPSSRCTNS